MMVEHGEKNTFGDQAQIYLTIYQKQYEQLKIEKFLLRKLKDIIEIKLLQDPYLFNIKLAMVIF